MFLRIRVAEDTFVHHNLPFRVHGVFRPWRGLGVCLPYRELHCEFDELYILDSKSLLLWERSRFQPALHKRNVRILILFPLINQKPKSPNVSAQKNYSRLHKAVTNRFLIFKYALWGFSGTNLLTQSAMISYNKLHNPRGRGTCSSLKCLTLNS